MRTDLQGKPVSSTEDASVEAATSVVPEVGTERLLLRAHLATDLDACAAMWADPKVARFIGGKTFSREETWWKILRYRGLWALLGFGYWAIEEKATGRFIGEVGFADFMRDLQSVMSGTPEIGWALIPSAHGRGLATEAVGCALAWGDRHLAARSTHCLISEENLASIRVAEKCGYRLFERSSYKGEPTLIYCRSRN